MLKYIASCGLAGFALYLLVNAIINNGFDLFLSLGMGLGFLIAFSFAFAAVVSPKKDLSPTKNEIYYWAGVAISLTSIILSLYELEEPETALIIESWQFLLGISTLYLGFISLRSKEFKGTDSTIKESGKIGSKSAIPFLLSMIFLCASAIFFITPIYSYIANDKEE